MEISIHVPLAGDDTIDSATQDAYSDFYPRPPCGGRQKYSIAMPATVNFYPRPPCGGRLVAAFITAYNTSISIHVPLAGDDK